MSNANFLIQIIGLAFMGFTLLYTIKMYHKTK